MPHSIIAIPALNDNYIWTIIHNETKNAVIVDPGEASSVINALTELKLTLVAILITHHHWDHTNGIEKCLAHADVPVFAPQNDKVTLATHLLNEGDTVSLPDMELNLKVIDVPGHTLGHIAYYGHDWLFSGDTLFGAGCGRIFEGNAQMLYNSLQKLSSLPPATRVYCSHEYTINNFSFAKSVEPDNLHIIEQLNEGEKKRQSALPTLPSTIGIEKLVNPFLRCDSSSIINTLQERTQMLYGDPVAVFAALRELKNNW